jgi:hypothetical protein
MQGLFSGLANRIQPNSALPDSGVSKYEFPRISAYSTPIEANPTNYLPILTVLLARVFFRFSSA